MRATRVCLSILLTSVLCASDSANQLHFALRADPKTLERIKSEAAAAVKLGATGTPGIFVNGVRERGWGSYAGLRAMVERELAKGKDLAAAGTPARELPAARIRATAATNPKDPNETPIDPELWVRILTAD